MSSIQSVDFGSEVCIDHLPVIHHISRVWQGKEDILNVGSHEMEHKCTSPLPVVRRVVAVECFDVVSFIIVHASQKLFVSLTSWGLFLSLWSML